MPIAASDIEKSAYLRLLVLGAAKVGKSTTVLKSCEKPAYVINCDDAMSLKPASRFTKDFHYDMVTAEGPAIFQQIENAIAEARKGVKEGRYKTIVLDTLSFLARRVENVCLDSTVSERAPEKGPDGRRAYPLYKRRLIGVIERLFTCKAHVIVLSHWVESNDVLIEGQLAKKGEGIVPMLTGQARAEVGGLFQDIVFLEKRKDGSGRDFITNVNGVTGPGCRSLKEKGYEVIDADIGVLWQKMQESDKPEKKSVTVTKSEKKETK